MEANNLAPAAGSRRVNILALPAPTTGLYFLFIASLIAVGLFVGSWMHNAVLGREWVQSLSGCLALSTDQQPACTAPLEVRRGLWSLAGAGVVLALALGVLFVVPPVIRRRRKLKAPLPKHHVVVDRVTGLASQAGLRHVPSIFIGQAAMRDAFSFGRPGSPAVAVPPKVFGLLARPGPADGVLLHEFAHIRHRDVELAWLARSSWYVTLLVLVVPVVGAVWDGPSLLPHYLWRAALLAVLVELVTALVLREREYDADLRAAARTGSEEQISASLALLGTPKPSNWLARMRRRHPRPEERVKVLKAPQLAAKSNFLRACCAGLLAGTLGPLVIGTATPLLTGSSIALGGLWASAAVTGGLLGLTVGLDLLRVLIAESLAGPAEGLIAGIARSILTTAVGAGVGLAAGRQVSLAGIGQDLTAPLDPTGLIAPFVAGLGTVFVCAGFAAVCLPFAGLASRPLYFWVPTVLFNVALFVVMTWVAESLDLALRGFGWVGAVLWIQYGYDEWPAVTLAFLMAVIATLAAVFGKAVGKRGIRAWMFFPADQPTVEKEDRVSTVPVARIGFPLVLGMVAGVGGSIFLLWQLLLISPIATVETATRANDLWLSTTVLTWAATAVVLCLVDPVRAPATLFISGPVSLGFCAAGVAIFWFASTDAMPVEDLLSIWAPAMARGLAVSLVLTGLLLTIRHSLAAITARRRKRPSPQPHGFHKASRQPGKTARTT